MKSSNKYLFLPPSAHQAITYGTGVGKNSFFNSISAANAKAAGGTATAASAVNAVSDTLVTGATDGKRRGDAYLSRQQTY